MRAHQCSPCRFMPPGTCSFPLHPALTNARPLPPFGTNPFGPPPLLHSSFLWCLQITCLCKDCLCLHEDRLAGASPTHLPSWLPPPWPRLLSSLAFHHGTGTGLSWALLHRPRWLPSTPGRLCAWTTVSSRPAKEDPLTLREILGWFSRAGKSNIGHPGDPHRSTPQECCWMSSQVLPGCRGSRAPG